MKGNLSWHTGTEGYVQALSMLLKQSDIDINLKDSEGRSPLLWAAKMGQANSIDVLLQGAHHVDRLDKDKKGSNALCLACVGSHTETVKALLKYRCGNEDEEDSAGWTTLLWAIERRQSLNTLEALLSGRTVNVNHRDRNERTALMWVAKYGFPETLQKLLYYGADPSLKDSRGTTALDLAKRHQDSCDHIEVRNILEGIMSQGVRVENVDVDT